MRHTHGGACVRVCAWRDGLLTLSTRARSNTVIEELPSNVADLL